MPCQTGTFKGEMVVVQRLSAALILSLLVAACDDEPSSPTPDTDINQETSELSPDADLDAVPELCQPACAGRVCGDDGCGGECGSCAEGSRCEVGACVLSDCPADCSEDCPQGCFSLGDCLSSSELELMTHPKVLTAGVFLESGSNASSAQLYHRVQGASHWWRAHDAIALEDGRLASALFGLRADTEYELLMRFGGQQVCGSLRTWPDEPEHRTETEIWVEAGATGGDGSANAPFGSIGEALALAGPGVELRVRAGQYHEAVRITSSGAEGAYLRLRAEPGAQLIGVAPELLRDGLSWTALGAQVYQAPWTGAPSYLSRDGKRFYHYTSRAGLESGLGDDDEPIAEGWFVENGQLLVRCLNDPSQHQWQVPSLETAIALDGASWVWLEGFEILYYGEGSYPKGIDLRGSSHIVVRNNRIAEVSSPIWARRGGSHLRIEHNHIFQSNDPSWPWAALKGSDHENSAISIDDVSDVLVSGNDIHDIFNGIATGSFSDDHNPAIALDVDVYANRFARIGDDALEPEGACINNRFWGNVIDTTHNGISLAPITWGPVWVLRNRFTDYEQSGIKFSNDSDGRVYLYHNTCYTARPDHNGLNVSGAFENMVFRNNIVHGTRYAFEMSREAGPNELDYDNFYSSRGAPLIKWDNVRYDTLADWCAATGLECHGHSLAPDLLEPAGGRFGLRESSPNLDAGLHIYGINDAFLGAAPDLGYVELGGSEASPLP
ncbi:MAG: right-handed parallel beta-helix repeat-containing protein [Myxococcota bacterium]|jgi:hypothetical protein|nr:right-handed parallel beta-helix repeat-containing protein [Myxococcota bacterium]